MQITEGIELNVHWKVQVGGIGRDRVSIVSPVRGICSSNCSNEASMSPLAENEYIIGMLTSVASEAAAPAANDLATSNIVNRITFAAQRNDAIRSILYEVSCDLSSLGDYAERA